jgi:hypothetical protein
MGTWLRAARRVRLRKAVEIAVAHAGDLLRRRFREGARRRVGVGRRGGLVEDLAQDVHQGEHRELVGAQRGRAFRTTHDAFPEVALAARLSSDTEAPGVRRGAELRSVPQPGDPCRQGHARRVRLAVEAKPDASAASRARIEHVDLARRQADEAQIAAERRVSRTWRDDTSRHHSDELAPSS